MEVMSLIGAWSGRGTSSGERGALPITANTAEQQRCQAPCPVPRSAAPGVEPAQNERRTS